MVSLTINWNNPDLETLGLYFILDVASEFLHVSKYNKSTTMLLLLGEYPQFITDISRQEDSFLIEGEQKIFICGIFGGWQFNASCAVSHDQGVTVRPPSHNSHYFLLLMCTLFILHG